MKSFESDIQKLAQKTRLKAIEREAIRDRILSYMEYHPLKKAVEKESFVQSLTERNFIYLSFRSHTLRIASGVLMVVLIVGIPFLAEHSVPGDMLYLVKTGVNEGIRSQLASSPYEKVALETRLIERRIAEARLLASEGKLTEEVEAQIAETVKGHAVAVQNGLAELREDDADEAALAEIAFSSTLAVQSAVLDQSEETGSSSVASILDVVNTVRDEVASDGTPSIPSYEGLVARIESETTRAAELFETVKRSATSEETRDITRRLSDIDRLITDAKKLHETDETGSVGHMIDALGLIQKLITFMTDIDVRETVELESLVPVTFTVEERTAAVHTLVAELESSLAIIETKIGYVEDEAEKEKMTTGLEKARTLLADLNTAISDGDIARAENNAKEVGAIRDDLSKVTESIVIPELIVDPDAEGQDETSTTTDSEATTTEPEIIESDGAETPEAL